MEKRTKPCELRAAEKEEGKLRASGVAILYGDSTVLYEDGEVRYEEVIAPGAATKSLAEDDIRALWNHNRDIVLGRNSGGTLLLSEESDGVHVSIDFPDSQEGRDKYISVDRGDVSQMSFGFDILKETVTEDRTGDKRIIRSQVEAIKIWEVSPVTFPAYENTSIGTRDRISSLKERASALSPAGDFEAVEARANEIEIMRLRSDSWKN